MNEADLTDSLMGALQDVMPGGVGFKHHDMTTAGIPDVSWSWGGFTVWIEVKFADPVSETRPAQIVTMRHLARAAIAFYVTYKAIAAEPMGGLIDLSVVILSPLNGGLVEYHGHDHRKVAHFIKEAIRLAAA